MTEGRISRLAGTRLLCILATLAACTSQEQLRKAELADLSVVLPGVYSNPTQQLVILNVFSPMLEKNVLYLRETAADDPRRVFSERIWILEVGSTGHIVATVYAFEEPDHWRGGADNPEIFRPLMLKDLRPFPGCELIWVKSPQGYSATAASPRCPHSWRLEGEQLAFSDRPVDPTPGAPDGYFHFVRQGAPQ